MALFVSNPRDRKGRFKKGAKKTKAKGAARTANPKPRAKRRTARRAPNPAPIRRRRTAKGHMKVTRRRRRTAHRTANPAPRRRRTVKRTRRYARNPRSRTGRYVARRRSRRARNALTISNPMRGIPVIGTAISMIGPALFGAIGVEAIGQAHNLVERMAPGMMPEFVQPYTYTIGGLVIAGIVQMLTFLPAPLRHSLGLATASAGGAVDWYRYRSGSGAYGDGGSWSVQNGYGALELGDDEAYGALELSGLDFSGDADMSPPDFSMAEGEAAAEGYGAYMRRFPLKPAHLHDPRREGDRFHWLAAAVGPVDFKRVANMPPQERLRMIAACREACRGVIRNPGTFAPPHARQIEEHRRPPILTIDAQREKMVAPFLEPSYAF